MPAQRFPESEYMIPRGELFEHAVLGVLKNAAAGAPGLEHWVAGTVRKTPLAVHDINGQPLFYDFDVARGKDLFGTVRVAASKVIGAGVVAAEIGARQWNYDEAVKKLARKVKREFGRAAVAGPTLVCYSYPKLGVMFEVEGENRRVRVIYDVSSLSRVPETSEAAGREGFTAWSFYGALTDEARKQRLARFRKEDEDRDSVPAPVRREILAARSLEPVLEKVKIPFSRNVTGLLQFCSHYGHAHARSHHCFVLHGQQVDDYCAVATCQMILCYYRYYYTQDQIAPSLGYAPGGCPSDQSPGYKSLTCNHLDSSFDASPTWEKARDQINLLRPLKSGISGHARACAGYSFVRWTFGGGITARKLYIYDPWPWNADYAQGGTLTWEDWDAIAHTNYVYANIKCP